MKPIRLTEEHKSKLLEMCNKLFPNKGKWFDVLDGNIYYSNNGKYPGLKVHWYELCIIHLSTKIFELIDKNTLGIIDFKKSKGTLVCKYSNPIDCLYPLFKNLNL